MYIFVLVVYVHPDYGEYVTLFPKLFSDKETTDWKTIVFRKHKYSGFLPVFECARRRRATFIENGFAPKLDEALPKMRQERLTVVDDELRTHWIIWDGDLRTEVTELSPQQSMLPHLAIINPDFFIKQALQVLQGDDSSQVLQGDDSSCSRVDFSARGKALCLKLIIYRVYFESQDIAVLFARTFDNPLACNVSRTGDIEWLATVSLSTEVCDEDVLSWSKEVVARACRYGGSYDGWEFEIRNNDGSFLQ